jgi:hypothetical protein
MSIWSLIASNSVSPSFGAKINQTSVNAQQNDGSMEGICLLMIIEVIILGCSRGSLQLLGASFCLEFRKLQCY